MAGILVCRRPRCGHRPQGACPAPLQLGRHSAGVGVARVIWPLGSLGGILRPRDLRRILVGEAGIVGSLGRQDFVPQVQCGWSQSREACRHARPLQVRPLHT